MTINGISGQSYGSKPFMMDMGSDSTSKNLQSQIANAQKQMQELASNKEMSPEDKMNKRKEIQEQINILGDDGVPVDYHETFWKAEVIDFVILQQDAFDKIDSVTPLERQKYMMELVIDIVDHDYDFDNFLDVNDYFKRVINICKQMNYSEFHSEQFESYVEQLKDLLSQKQIVEQ